jgi:hypothetical protein
MARFMTPSEPAPEGWVGSARTTHPPEPPSSLRRRHPPTAKAGPPAGGPARPAAAALLPVVLHTRDYAVPRHCAVCHGVSGWRERVQRVGSNCGPAAHACVSFLLTAPGCGHPPTHPPRPREWPEPRPPLTHSWEGGAPTPRGRAPKGSESEPRVAVPRVAAPAAQQHVP